MNAPHIPVLADQVVEIFADVKSGVIVDCTLGYAGHAELLLEKYPHITYIGIDRDSTAIEFSRARLARFGDRFLAINGKFSEVLPTLTDQPISGVLADLGVSSLQLDDSSRGFGFLSDTLDMRMDKTSALSASSVINEYPQTELEQLIREYGEEKNARKIAELIAKNRPFASAKELASLIEQNFKRGKIHPATLTFQAIRIEVNGELKEVESLLKTVREFGKDALIIAIISFHSLEDRLVKNAFREWSKSCICPPESYRCTCGNNHAMGKQIGKKPLVADQAETKQNPRSRSAKLRGFRFGG